MKSLTILILTPLLLHAQPSAEQIEFFEKEIRPVLVEHCYECHNGEKQKGGLRLDFAGGWKAGGDSGPVISVGHAKDSLLWRSVAGLEDDLKMPKGADALPQKAVTALAKWIDAGAPDPRAHAPTAAETQAVAWESKLARRRAWWSLQPIQPSAVALGDTTDHFIQQRLRTEKLAPAPEADALTLLRRVSYVLTGLPPSEQEVLDVERDPARWDYTDHVDRLIASEAFGERWARLWMDMVRYADTQGDQANDVTRDAWAYRDYLVRAFNQDLPLDSLVREHIAGDLVPSRRRRANGDNESILGTTFYRFVEIGSIGEDPRLEEISLIDNQIDALSKSFQGLTISCARCHDHKFDAIATADYYALYGLLKNTRQRRHVITSEAAWKDEAAHLETRKGEIRSALANVWKEKLAALNELPVASGNSSELASDASLPTGTRMSLDGWHAEGPAFARAGEKVTPRPEWSLFPDGEVVVRGIYGPGIYSDRITERLTGVLQSPDFAPKQRYVSLRVVGGNVANARIIVENYQTFQAGGNGPFHLVTPYLNATRPQWITLDLQRWQGMQAYLELASFDFLMHPRTIEFTRDGERLIKPSPKPQYEHHLANPGSGSWFGLQEVVFHDAAWKPAQSDESNPPRTLEAARQAIASWAKGNTTHDQAELLNGLLDAGVLPNQIADLPEKLREHVNAWREANRALPDFRYASGVADTGNRPGVPVFGRGAYQNATGAPVPAGFLGVLDPKPFDAQRPYRLQLAEAITVPSNPLAARVLANRLWYGVFGRGIVASLDNFGTLGELPSHPELLDALASSLMQNGWSTKKFIRALVTSRTFRQSSISAATAMERDPGNRLLHHYPVRRLEAEWLLDSLRAVSVGFAALSDAKVYQPTISREFLNDKNLRDGRTISDPWNVRVLYVGVDRSRRDLRDLFGMSRRSQPIGARDVPNLPEQGLAQLNGAEFARTSASLAVQLTERAAKSDAAEAVRFLSRRVLGRTLGEDELTASLHWLGDTPVLEAWQDLAHVFLLRRDFLYLQ